MGLLNFLGESLHKKLLEEDVNRFIREVDTFMSAYEKVGIEKMYGHKNQLITMQSILDDYSKIIKSHEKDFHNFMQNKISLVGQGKMTIFQVNGVMMASVGTINEIVGPNSVQLTFDF